MLRRVALRPEISRYTVGGAVAAALAVALVLALVSGGGGQSRIAAGSPRPVAKAAAAKATHAKAGVSAVSTRAAGHAAAGHAAAALVHPLKGAAPAARFVAEAPDPYQSLSDPAPPSVHHARAIAPASAAEIVAPGAPSDAQIRKELAQMNAAIRAQESQAATTGGGSIAGGGTVAPPPDVPQVVDEVIAGGDAIATFPYVYGGGHASFVDNAYDCSGSVSYALAAAGLLSAPETSGQLESWGAPGPGQWITVYANAGHTFMYVDGLRFDTVGRSGVFGTRWQTAPPPEGTAGFVVRHWPGL